jgi:hypothetical protein
MKFKVYVWLRLGGTLAVGLVMMCCHSTPEKEISTFLRVLPTIANKNMQDAFTIMREELGYDNEIGGSEHLWAGREGDSRYISLSAFPAYCDEGGQFWIELESQSPKPPETLLSLVTKKLGAPNARLSGGAPAWRIEGGVVSIKESSLRYERGNSLDYAEDTELPMMPDVARAERYFGSQAWQYDPGEDREFAGLNIKSYRVRSPDIFPISPKATVYTRGNEVQKLDIVLPGPIDTIEELKDSGIERTLSYFGGQSASQILNDIHSELTVADLQGGRKTLIEGNLVLQFNCDPEGFVGTYCTYELWRRTEYRGWRCDGEERQARGTT